MIERAISHGCCSDYKRAIGDSLGQRSKALRCGENLRGIHSGASRLQRRGVVADDAKMAKAEVVHRAGSRPDIVRITCPHQHNDDAVQKIRSHITILGLCEDVSKLPQALGKRRGMKKAARVRSRAASASVGLSPFAIVVSVAVDLPALVVLLAIDLLALLLGKVAAVSGAVVVNLLVDAGFVVLNVTGLPRRELA